MVTSERDELAKEKSTLEGQLTVMMSQTRELQVHRREIISMLIGTIIILKHLIK